MRFPALVVCVVAAGAAVGCGWLDDRAGAGRSRRRTPPAPSRRNPRSSRRRARRLGAAVNDFFWVKSKPTQPIEFPHNIHIEKGLACTEYCHEAVTKGPEAGLPSVNTCLICHAAIATDKPRIQQITAMPDKGVDLALAARLRLPAGRARQVQSRAAHPRQRRMFDVSRRHRASDGRAAQRRRWTWADCVNCHREKKAPNDCSHLSSY